MKNLLLVCLLIFILSSCIKTEKRIPIIFDTDTNNELDDQHALAYLLFNADVFDTKAITVNATSNGGDIDKQYAEAQRIMQLCKANGKVPLLKGADKSFNEIKDSINHVVFDGVSAVDFIIKEALNYSSENKLVVVAVGKLTNIALAVEKEPRITDKIRLVWLGANYPDTGEYNLVNDIPSMNFLLDTNIEFEMVTVRYGKDSGTDHVKVFKKNVLDKKIMKGLGPKTDVPVIGRHGGEFYCFGDYSHSLFEHCQFHGDKQYRALFDMAAVAIVKNPEWAKTTIIPAPLMVDEKWVDRPENKRKIILWEYFNRDAIIEDLLESLRHYSLVKR
ncbi:MAG: nucleoside hydrolase [Bacteroidales bacterium]|nr:nucleoside hydrolase [Bacteroidales bacterium]